MGYAHGIQWSRELVLQRVAAHAERLGHMPTSNELRAANDNVLACAIPRYGGYRRLAAELGVPLKGTETHFAQAWEDHEESYFRSLGFDVERQTTKAPFDLLVNGRRVDVKAAHATAASATTRAFHFAGLKGGRHADAFDLLCIGDGRVRARFLIPASAARVQTVTILAGGGGKYDRWLSDDDRARQLLSLADPDEPAGSPGPGQIESAVMRLGDW